MFQWLAKRVNLWVILGGILVAGVLVVLLGVLIFFMPAPASRAGLSKVSLTVIVAPTPTLSPTPYSATATPTALVSVGGISIGSYVQITGTEGEGLRLRSGPGTDSPMRFVGMDDEVFQVKDGPKQANDYTWWYLVAPYDPSRSGWAASKFFKVVSGPVTTPTAVP